jgi:hypothetical protein
MRRKSGKRALAVALIAGALALLSAEPAHAIIGMPWTPMSYAGVARRTTRRAVMFGAAAAPVYPAPAYPAPAYPSPAVPASPYPPTYPPAAAPPAYVW